MPQVGEVRATEAGGYELWNGSAWVSLKEGDVRTTASGDYERWDGSKWVPTLAPVEKSRTGADVGVQRVAPRDL